MTASEVQRGSSTLESAPTSHEAPVRVARTLRHGGKVLPEHARSHNRSLVLQTLFHAGAMSRADLARETGLTRVTVSDLVAELIADGFIVERGPREGGRPGKPAILVDIDHGAHRIIGLDLSGPDSFLGAILTLDGEIVARHSVARPSTVGGDDAVQRVIDLAKTLVADSHAPVLGVGVGTPGVVDADDVIVTAPNLGWVDLDLRRRLEEELSLPVLVANDANAAVLAEYTFGRGHADLMLVKVGAGVGSGLLAGSQPMRGARGASGEIGHVTVGTDGGPMCACGKVGCLEAWLSVPSLTRALGGTSDPATVAVVLRDAGERLGIALAPIVGALDLSEIVLSGPEELLAGELLDQTVATLRARILAARGDGITVRMTAQGEDIVLRGAAVMVLSGRLGVS